MGILCCCACCLLLVEAWMCSPAPMDPVYMLVLISPQARKKRYTKMQEEAQKYSRKRKGSGLPRHKKNVKHNKIH